MARLIGVDLPREKRLEIGLTYIFGIGRTRAKEILAATGISGDVRVKDLTDEQLLNAMIETPIALLHAEEICSAHERLTVIVMGTNDVINSSHFSQRFPSSATRRQDARCTS